MLVMNRFRHILVVADPSYPCPTLAEEVARRAADGPIKVLVVAPALNSRLRNWVSDVDDAVARADAPAAGGRQAARSRHQRPG
jgi:hypothetical protein